MSALLAEGFALGLSTGLYCLGACAPLMAPYLLAEAPGMRKNLRLAAEFLAGRLAAYLLFAAAVGWAGERWSGAVPPRLLGAGLLLSGLGMLWYAVFRGAPRFGLCLPPAAARPLAAFPFALGFLVGINVCPPFAAGMLRIVSLGGSARAAAYFAAFFAGTTLYMLPFLAAAPLSRFKRLPDIAALASGLCGAWFALLGLSRLT